MGDWIDFRELRSRLSFPALFEKYSAQISIKAGQRQATGPCPLPLHSGHRTKHSFSANLEKGIFQCFSCQAKGNILDFACLMSGRNPQNGSELREVANELQAQFGPVSLNAPKPRSSVEKQVPSRPSKSAGAHRINAPLDFELKGLVSDHPYLTGKRKLLPETVAYFGLGFCSRGRISGRIGIPLHNLAGQLVGYVGRSIDDDAQPKYLFPSTRKHENVTYEFRKTGLLYNAHRIKTPVHELILVEGFPSVWWLTQNGFPNCVAVMGSSLSEEQAKIVCSLVLPEGEVLILSDGDKAGAMFAEQASARLSKDRIVRPIPLAKDEQPTDKSRNELQLLVSQHDPPAGIGGGISSKEDICALIGEFPCFRGFGITPSTWDSEAFDKQALKFASGEIAVAQFILGVWNPNIKWQCGAFNLIDAAARLDSEHRKVIIDWFKKPWWP